MVIFVLCMVAIYGGINPKGLVLRETFNVVRSVRPTTTKVPIINATASTTSTTSIATTTTNHVSSTNSPSTIVVDTRTQNNPPTTSGAEASQNGKDSSDNFELEHRENSTPQSQTETDMKGDRDELARSTTIAEHADTDSADNVSWNSESQPIPLPLMLRHRRHWTTTSFRTTTKSTNI